jgi:hypothetical protein
MALAKIKYQQIFLTVDTPGQEVILDAETDKLYSTCTGINTLVYNPYAKFSFIQLHIGGLEILPENFEVTRIELRQNVPFGYEYLTLNEPAAGSKIRIRYIDKNGLSYPYTISFSFRLENVEPSDAGRL